MILPEGAYPLITRQLAQDVPTACECVHPSLMEPLPRRKITVLQHSVRVGLVDGSPPPGVRPGLFASWSSGHIFFTPEKYIKVEWRERGVALIRKEDDEFVGVPADTENLPLVVCVWSLTLSHDISLSVFLSLSFKFRRHTAAPPCCRGGLPGLSESVDCNARSFADASALRKVIIIQCTRTLVPGTY